MSDNIRDGETETGSSETDAVSGTDLSVREATPEVSDSEDIDGSRARAIANMSLDEMVAGIYLATLQLKDELGELADRLDKYEVEFKTAVSNGTIVAKIQDVLTELKSREGGLLSLISGGMF